MGMAGTLERKRNKGSVKVKIVTMQLERLARDTEGYRPVRHGVAAYQSLHVAVCLESCLVSRMIETGSAPFFIFPTERNTHNGKVFNRRRR